MCDREKKNTSKETREQSTDEQDVTGVFHEVRDRGGVDRVRGRDDRRRMEETSGTANEKGTEVKGNMGAKGDLKQRSKEGCEDDCRDDGDGSSRRARTHVKRRKRKTSGSMWRQTWAPVTHTPRPHQTRMKKKEQKKSGSTMKDSTAKKRKRH